MRALTHQVGAGRAAQPSAYRARFEKGAPSLYKPVSPQSVMV